MNIRKRLKNLARGVRHLSLIPHQAKYFIIIAQERTGSTLFSDLMSFHPKILMDLHHFYTIDTWPSRYTDGRTVFSTKPVRGYKFKVVHAPLQSSSEEANNKLKDLSRQIKIIRLERKNKLRQALSASASGALTGGKGPHIWKNENDRAPRGEVKLVVDVDQLLEDIKYYTRLTEFEDRALEGVPHLAVEYERDLLPQEMHQSTANRAFEYVGLQPVKVEARLERVSKPNISEYVANYDELAEKLQDSPYARYLPEPI